MVFAFLAAGCKYGNVPLSDHRLAQTRVERCLRFEVYSAKRSSLLSPMCVLISMINVRISDAIYALVRWGNQARGDSTE